MGGLGVGVAVDGDRLHAQLVAGPDDADRDLAAVGDEDAPERCLLGVSSGPPGSGVFAQRRGRASERDVAMLLPRVRVALVGEHLERADEPGPRLARQDDLVDVAACRRDVRVGELGLVLGDQALALGRRVVGAGDRVLEDDVDRALRAHHRDLRGGPGEVHVAADVLAAHDVVGAAVGLARDDRHLGHRRLAVGVEQLRAVLDDPAVLLGDAGQEARARRRRSRAGR